jgi:hypothetical protein
MFKSARIEAMAAKGFSECPAKLFVLKCMGTKTMQCYIWHVSWFHNDTTK